MRKIITMTLMMSAVCATLYFQKNTAPTEVKVETKKGGAVALSPSEKTLALQQTVPTPSEVEIKELDEVKAEFRDVLKKLKKVTAAYNKKAIAGKVTAKDEAAYAAAEKESLIAFNAYKKSFINIYHSKEN